MLPTPLPPVLVIPFVASPPPVIKLPPVMLPTALIVELPFIAPELEIVLAVISPALLVVTVHAPIAVL